MISESILHPLSSERCFWSIRPEIFLPSDRAFSTSSLRNSRSPRRIAWRWRQTTRKGNENQRPNGFVWWVIWNENIQKVWFTAAWVFVSNIVSEGDYLGLGPIQMNPVISAPREDCLWWFPSSRSSARWDSRGAHWHPEQTLWVWLVDWIVSYIFLL